MSDDAAYDNALAFASDGYRVLPIWPPIETDDGGYTCACGNAACRSPAKHPIGRLAPNGVLDASSDAAVIAAWHADAPGCNWGVATGEGFIVLDVDSAKGAGRLRELIQDHDNWQGNIAPTWCVSTGRPGARHFYYRTDLDIRCSAGRLGKHLDIRGRGGFVIIAGSRHISGHRYAWWDRHHPSSHAMAKLPDWLGQLLTEPAKPRPKPAEFWRELTANGVDEGCRHDSLCKLVGHLAANFVDPLVAHELVASWNRDRCRPPLGDDEVERVVADIFAREHG